MKKLTLKEILLIIREHRSWIDSTGLSGAKANFRGYDLSNVNLASEVMEGVDFSYSNLSRANLSNTTLMGCSFVGTNLSGANLSRTNLSNSDFTRANLSGSFLDYSIFLQSRLNDAIMLGASLKGTDFRESRLEQAKFTSRHSVRDLAYPLSDEQLFDVIFTDEENLAEQDTYAFQKDKEHAQELIIYLDAPYISPIYLSTFLLSLEGVFNNLYWLCSSKDNDLAVLLDGMRPFYQGVPHQEWIKVEQIESGSIKIKLTTLATIATVLFTLSQFLDKIATIDLTRGLKTAEIEKVKAETEKIKQETKKIEIEIENNKYQQALIYSPGNATLMSISEEDHVAIAKYKRQINYSYLGDILSSPNPTVNTNTEHLIEAATNPLLNVYYKFGQLGYKFRPISK